MRICSCTGNSWHSGCQYVYSGARLCLLNTADKNYRISLYIIYWSIRNGILVLQFWTAFFSSIRRFESTNQVLTPWGYSSFHSQVADSGSLWYTTSCIYRKEGRAWPQILPVDDCRQREFSYNLRLHLQWSRYVSVASSSLPSWDRTGSIWAFDSFKVS